MIPPARTIHLAVHPGQLPDNSLPAIHVALPLPHLHARRGCLHPFEFFLTNTSSDTGTHQVKKGRRLGEARPAHLHIT